MMKQAMRDGLRDEAAIGDGRSAKIDYDGNGFFIDGARLFLNIATIHYFRMPRQEWRDVLMKARLAGMNCIDTYFAWNIHEPEQGQWDFTGDNDCGAFLDLCAELGLWVIARPGPFICAEWDFGGFPWWLSKHKDMRYRTVDKRFIRYTELYFDRIIPIIEARQATRGGSVMMVQVENEYGYLADDEAGQRYMNGLRDSLLRRGIEVPLLTCEGGAEGTIEGANFWSGADGHYETLARKQPDAPKLATEFWTGWFEHWGGAAAVHKTAALYERRLMEALRAGFDGIGHYMFFGGTNFGGYGGRTLGASDIYMVTSYDYDAPLTEYGKITDKYRTAKKVSLFAHAMRHVLLEGRRLPAGAARGGEGLSLHGVEHCGQRLWFAESAREERAVFPVTLGTGRTISVTVDPGRIVPILDRIEIAPGIALTCGGVFPIGNDRIGEARVVVLAGADGQRTVLELESTVAIRYADDSHIRHWLSDDALLLRLDLYHFREPQRIRLSVGEQRVELIVLNGRMSDLAWRLEGSDGDEARWAIGYEELLLNGDGIVTGRAGGAIDGSPLLLGWGSRNSAVPIRADLSGGPHAPGMSGTSVAAAADAPDCARSSGRLSWSMRPLRLDVACEASPSRRPSSFTDGCQPFGYRLYNCEVESGEDRDSVLILSRLGDSARVYINGREQAFISDVGAASAAIRLPKGRSRLQLLVQHMGRLNFSPYVGEEKGLSGPVYLDGRRVDLRRGWQLAGKTVQLDETSEVELPATLSNSFALAPGERAMLVGELFNGLVVNGKPVALEQYRDWFAFQAIDLSDAAVEGVNQIEMPVDRMPLKRLELLIYSSGCELTGWTAFEPEEAAAERWAALADGVLDRPAGTPAWYRCSFGKPAAARHAAALRLRLTGMSKGFIRLNGRDMGRYWQIGPQEDYKLPMAWINEKDNELILFDEEGRTPTAVQLLPDEDAERRWHPVG